MSNDQYKHDAAFTPEQIDEQIEQSLHHPQDQQADLVDKPFINELSGIYSEYSSQRDRIWQRIAAGMEQQPQVVRKDSPMEQAQKPQSFMPPHPAKLLHRQRWQVAFSVLVAGLIIASTLWLISSKVSTSTIPLSPSVNKGITDAVCAPFNDAGWLAICHSAYNQPINQSQSINTHVFGKVKFAVDSAYIDSNRAIIKYTSTRVATSKIYELIDHPHLTINHGMKFQDIQFGMLTTTEQHSNKSIISFETPDLTHRSGNISLQFIDDILVIQDFPSNNPRRPGPSALLETYHLKFNFSIKIQPDYKVVSVQQTQTVDMGKLTFQRIIITPSATRLIMSGVRSEIMGTAGLTQKDQGVAAAVSGVYFGKRHVTYQQEVMIRLLQKKPPVFEIFYFQALFNQSGQWSLHWPDYMSNPTGKPPVDTGYIYTVAIK
ncbi:hypothetical protein KDW_27550 [Dictyobacter vulcani]|uniref:DUF4179 domain-containing protein n=1 Tax=Dictyobacter vulcani TaxID=2607529 RepID=A0A5J4KLD7_9CHLR|nr:hypothetical protein [Dictyobacter vulcani]GER88593.1 hypothetical protein KDW_27550 [Dictyobacter vulcani]